VDDYVALVTSKEWREKVASGLMLEGLSPLAIGDPYAWLEWYASRNKPIPAWVGLAIAHDRKPKKGGRHSRREEQAKQFASDIACYLAMEYLLDKGFKRTPAGELVGKAMGLSRQAVLGGHKRQAIWLVSKDIRRKFNLHERGLDIVCTKFTFRK
jgi:hypothetical protein